MNRYMNNMGYRSVFSVDPIRQGHQADPVPAAENHGDGNQPPLLPPGSRQCRSVVFRIQKVCTSAADANLHALWQIMHNLEAAIAVGIHDLDHSTVEVVVDNLKH